jgi:hypothetical protein
LAAAAIGNNWEVQNNPVKVLPKQMAPIGIDFVQKGPWVTPKNSRAYQTDVAFDAFEPDSPGGAPTDGAANGGYDPDCGLGSSRWWGGATANAPQAVADMNLRAGFAGQMSTHMQLAWFNYYDMPNLYIAVFTTEDFNDTCTGDPFTEGYDGVVLHFTDLAGNGGYYYTDVDTDGQGFGWQLPMDGKGGYYQLLASDYDGTTFTLAKFVQFMRWAPKNAAAQGTQGPMHWIDNRPANGKWDTGECYDTTNWHPCPKPVSAMTIFYGNPPAANEIVPVNAFVVVKGTHQSGDVNSFTADDDNYLNVGAQYDPTDPLAVINATVRMDGNASAGSYSSGLFRVKEKCNTTQAKYRVRLFKSNGGFATPVDGVQTAFTETLFEPAIPSPVGDFIDGANGNRVRSETRAATSNKLAGFFRYSIDLAQWEFVP